MRARGLTGIIMAVLLAGSASAQTVLQSGNVTQGHTTSWAGSGVVHDAGTSDTPNITTQGILANGGTPFCINTALDPNPRLKFCMGVQNNGAATLSLFSYNGASIVPFQLDINGVIYPFPITPSSTFGALRQVSSGTTDTASSLDGTIAWNSASTSAKTEFLPACVSGNKGSIIIVVDEKSTAGAYPITVSPAGGNTINNASTFIMAFNNQSASFQCNGNTNWLVL